MTGPAAPTESYELSGASSSSDTPQELPAGPESRVHSQNASSTITRGIRVEHKSDEPQSAVDEPQAVVDVGNGVVDAHQTIRDLTPLQLAAITFNATVGIGVYWNAGHVLQVAGPFGLFLAYFIPFTVAFAVMQCVCELSCLWPISGSFKVYIETFLDRELADIAGIAYFLTYSASFSALLSVFVSVLELWTKETAMDVQSFNIGVVYIVVTLIMIAINSLPVKYYGRFELVCGIIKLLTFFTIVVMNLVAVIMGTTGTPAPHELWKDATRSYNHELNAAGGWAQGLLIGSQEAVFAYVGLEIVAALGVEVRGQHGRPATLAIEAGGQPRWRGLTSTTFKRCAIWMAPFIGALYTVAIIVVSLGVDRSDCALSPPAWFTSHAKSACQSHVARAEASTITQSVFVHLMREMGSLKHFVNFCIAFSAFTCASTNLYVASRQLHGMVHSSQWVEQNHSNPLKQWVSSLALFFRVTTTSYKVPVRAVWASAVLFLWVPIWKAFGSQTARSFAAILSTTGTVGVLVVWAAVSAACLRYYYAITTAPPEGHAALLNRYAADYPYRGSFQPFTAWFAIVGCIFFIFVASSASHWSPTPFSVEQFLSSYLVIILFLVLWIVLKLARAKWKPHRINWRFADLHYRSLKDKIRGLDDGSRDWVER